MGARFRRVLHFVAADLLYYCGTLTLWRFLLRTILRKQRTCVLGLHRVLTRTEQARTNSLDGMVMSDRTFVKLLEYLQRKFVVVSLEDFLANDETKGRSARPRCLLTFDDGWGDTYKTAYSWLRKFEMPAVVFVATGSMECTDGFWIERLCGAFNVPSMRDHIHLVLNEMMPKNGARRSVDGVIEWLKHMPAQKRDSILRQLLAPHPSGGQAPQTDGIDAMMTWGQAFEMSRDGIAIAAHTVSHPLLTYEDDVTAEIELLVSKKTIEERLDCRVRALAYPNGDWDERIRGWVKRTGYGCAFTTRPGWYQRGQDRYTIRRILLHEGNVTGRDGKFSPAMFSLTLAGRA
jgi:peptidoglycan/xylan/chitin deacetylase (PgdA/CDA1 family)